MPNPAYPRFRLRFHRLSFILFVILFGVEVVIALFFTDPWIRPLLGDVLVVMMIAYGVHAIVALPLRQIAIATLLFAYGIEYLQSLHLIDRLGWQDSQLARLIIGSTFDWRDLVAYTIGIAIVILVSPPAIADR